MLIIDSPLTPMSSRPEIEDWIARLHELMRQFGSDRGVMKQLTYELERAEEYRREATASETRPS